MKKYIILIVIVTVSLQIKTFGQALSVYYAGPQVYSTGVAITALNPTVTGGPAAAGGQTTQTFAGASAGGYSNGTGTGAYFNNPINTAVDAEGNVYVTDAGNHVIRKITPLGAVTTLAGGGIPGYADGTGGTARFQHPTGIAIDPSGNLFVSDQQNHRIRKITPAGVVTTVAGSGSAGTSNGTGTAASFNYPIGLTLDPAGNLYVCDSWNNKIRKITVAGVVSDFAGSGVQGSSDSPSYLSATFNKPTGIAIDGAGNFYVSDRYNHKIRKIGGGWVSTFAGSGSIGSAAGSSTSASFNYPTMIAIDPWGNLFVSDQANNMVRKITAAGVVTNFAGTTAAATVNGTGSVVRFSSAYGLSVDAQGNIYVAENGAHNIRKIATQPFTIFPNLPAGLTFNNSTGAISGTPLVASPATDYFIQGFNLTFQSNLTTANITVNASPIGIQGSANMNYVAIYTPKVSSFVNEISVKAASSDKTKVQTTIQYLDGLGREVQHVNAMANDDGTKDLVSVVEYDELGRFKTGYLPYMASAATGNYRPSAAAEAISYYQGTHPGVVQTSYPYNKPVYEPSPMNRINEQGSAGSVWQPFSVAISGSGRTKKNVYRVNTASDTVKLWTLGGSGASSTADYSDGSLTKFTRRDENWTSGNAGTIDEYKDKEGRVVCKRIWETNSIARSTYYVFDEWNRLRYVIPPKITVTSFIEGDTQFDQLVFAYHYDGPGRLIEEKAPGKGWEEMVYDNLDRLAMKRDAVLALAGKWLFNKYDTLGRTIITGIINSGSSRATWQTSFVNKTANRELRDNSNASGTGTGYTNGTLPAHSLVEYYHTINYYDDYNFYGNTFGAPTGLQVTAVKSFQTGAKVNVLGSGTMLLTTLYYDASGRVSQNKKQNYPGGTDVMDFDYNFDGNMTSMTRTHVLSGQTTMVYINYEYDHAGRKTKTYQRTGNSGSPQVLLSEQIFNEIGQLKDKKFDNNLAAVNYTYNEREWLKTMTSTQFSMRLKYNDGTTPQYNGNVSVQDWGSGGTFPNTFTYTYDKLNRLTNGTSTGISMSEILTYDPNGNIKTLNRDAAGLSTYSYTGNRLNSIAGGSVSTVVYNYDLNGNATTDGRTGIIMTYNFLNLPVTANRASATPSVVNMAFTYDANGTLLKEINSVSGTTRYYVDGIEYNGATIDVIRTEAGLARNSGGAYSYEYNLADHLGNVRYSFYRHPSTSVLTRLQGDDYYAFGKRRSVSPVSTTNKYLYNSKDLLEELNSTGKEGQYNFGARFYDAEIGRWNVLDPMNQTLSGYDFCGNNPLINVDPDGRFFGTVFGFLKGVGEAIFSGGLEFWNADRAYVSKAWRKADPFLSGTAGNNGFKIDMGLVKGKFGQILSRFTWELPQTLLGYTAANVKNLSGNVSGVSYWGGATVISGKEYSEEAFTLGSYISGGSNLTADPTNHLFVHEYGHYLQSQSFGPFYLSKIAVPSYFSKGNHKYHPAEMDANARSKEFFEKKVPGIVWNDFENPVPDANFRLKLKWYDFVMLPFNYTIVGSLVPGLINSGIQNGNVKKK